MGHYDECYEADAKEETKKRHKEIKKELVDLINKLNDDERELIIGVIKNMGEFKSTIKFIKNMIK